MTRKRKTSRNRQPSQSAAAEDEEFFDAFQEFVGEVMLLNGRFLSVAAELGDELGISPPQWQAVVVAKGQPRTVSQYARRLGIQRQSMQYTISGLVERGFMELLPNPDHRRSPLIRLTDAGANLVTQLQHREIELCRRFTRGLDLTGADMNRLRAELHALRMVGAGSDET